MRDPTSPGRRLDAGRQPWPPLRLARAPRAEDLRAAPRWRSDSAQTSPTTRRVRAGADSGQRSSSPQRPPPLAVYAIAETGPDRRKPTPFAAAAGSGEGLCPVSGQYLLSTGTIRRPGDQGPVVDVV